MHHLINRFHVAVPLFSNRPQMTNVLKTKKCWRWYFHHILTSSVICYWTDPRQHGIYFFYTMIRKDKRPIHIPALYRLTVRRFVLVWAFFLSPKRYISSLLLLFFFILLVYSFFEKFSTSFLAQSRIMAKTFCKTASLSWRWCWTAEGTNTLTSHKCYRAILLVPWNRH